MRNSTVLIVAVAVLALWVGCSEGQGDGTVLVLGAVLTDHAPNTMNHSRFDPTWWSYNGWTNYPNDGSCGTANGGFGYSNSDFEYPLWWYGTIRTPNAKGGVLTNGEAGLVGKCCNKSNNFANCGTLDTTSRLPVYQYPDHSPLYTILNPTSFAKWYVPMAETKQLNMNLTLANQGGRTYSYANNAYFPFDGLGWQDWQYADDGKTKHNYGYTMQIHGRFSYQGGETFYFYGDDDVFVYLDNRLVIDLGGVHTSQTAFVNVDDMKLTKGNNYRFDFFYSERHSTNSKLQITTSIAIACTYYDWCDQCNGNGQSCCTAADLQTCNDNDACTTDQCAILVPPNKGCQNTKITCNDNLKCTTDSCDPKLGCVFKNITCDDGSVCTTDACDPNSGTCVFTPITCTGDKCNTPGCDKVNGCYKTAVTCDDQNLCTADACSPTTGCTFTPIPCDDNDKCTTDVCTAAGGCKHTPNAPCNDNNACTTDTCDPINGCQFTKINCDDLNKCTDDSCDTTKGCVHTPTVCNDNSMCTTDSCINATGCSFVNIPCDDHNACTADSCNATIGCVNTPVPCNDNNACTADSCNPASGCSYQQISCDDKNACTNDTCSTLTGCAHANISSSCDDKNDCTTDSCDPSSGCVHVPVNCDDNDACTDDTCKTSGGCQHTTHSCDDKNACTVDACDKKTGCGYTPLPCNDNNACTNDTCNILSGCMFTNITCDDNNNCTLDSCDTVSGCKHTSKNCNDNNECTADTCDVVKGCQNAPIPCNLCTANGVKVTCAPINGSLCFPVECDPGSGACNITRAVVCDDGSACTKDSCTAATGQCVFAPISCDDGNGCTFDSCDIKTGCAHVDKSCDDKNPCTTDSCTNSTGACVNAPLPGLCISCNGAPCTWTDACNPKTCINNTCVATPVNCDDNNMCTIDSCYTSNGKGVCNNTAIPCDNSNPCKPQTCNTNTGVCDTNPVTCDDHNACTTDSCDHSDGVAKCWFNTTTPCNSDPCNVRYCNITTGACIATPTVCNDNNACTDDSCDAISGKCTFVARPCATTDSCNPKSCNTTTGVCSGTPVVCDDNNLCTTDSCYDNSGTPKCLFAAVNCSLADPCAPQSCNASTGKCDATPVNCDDGNFCTDDICVNSGGKANCTHPLISCANFSTGEMCTPPICNTSIGCQAGVSICNDLNPCTTDTCVGPMNCSFVTNQAICNDSNPCTDDVCNPNAADPLDRTQLCSYTNHTCVAVSKCQVVAGCDNTTGCAFTPLTCTPSTDWCTNMVCDESVGCIPVPKTCPVSNADCYSGACHSDTQSCSSDQRPGFATIGTKDENGQDTTCYALYNKAATAGIIAGGVIAAIVVAAVIFAALAALGARKAYLFMQLRQGNMGAAQSNPLYTPGTASGENPLFAG